jgi:hypothetical protein
MLYMCRWPSPMFDLAMVSSASHHRDAVLRAYAGQEVCQHAIYVGVLR